MPDPADLSDPGMAPASARPDKLARERLIAAVSGLERPAVVGLSGFGGAGKSTLAAAVAAASPDVALVPGDHFLIRSNCLRVSDDWAGVDRARLSAQLVEPFRRGLSVTYDAYDWESDSLAPQALAPCRVLLVEGVGLIHPSLSWDLSVWLDCDPAVALGRAMARDSAQEHDLSGWPIWHETDLLYAARFRPDVAADLVVG